MCSPKRILLLAFVAQVSSRDPVARHPTSEQNHIDMLVDDLTNRLFDRALEQWSSIDLENTTLGKGSGHLSQSKILLTARQPQIIHSLKWPCAKRTNMHSRYLSHMPWGTRCYAKQPTKVAEKLDFRAPSEVVLDNMLEGWKPGTKSDDEVLLDVKDLWVEFQTGAEDMNGEPIDVKSILHGTNLKIRPGEVHVIMGENGCGKSTLAKTIVGNPDYIITKGCITYKDEDLLELDPDERSHAGLFLSWQNPPSADGIINSDFLRIIYNAKANKTGGNELDPLEFYGHIMPKLKDFDFEPTFLNRGLNEGMSGGERKRNEMLHMSVLNPDLAILDEIDSGLDIDSLQDIANFVSKYVKDRKANPFKTSCAVLIITHYRRLLDYVKPDIVHVMLNGTIVESGGVDFLDILDEKGYDYWRERFLK